jgi:hypothetical protein
MTTELSSHVPVSDAKLQAIVQWLTWITEGKLYQSVQQKIEHPTQEYHRYLETTYALRFLHRCKDNQVTEDMMIDPQT